MPVPSTVYVLTDDDYLVIEKVKISASKIFGFKILYDLSSDNTDSFYYAFRIVFNKDDISDFNIIRKGLESSEKIFWFNDNQKTELSLSVHDATVAYDDNDMVKKNKQILDIILLMESEELKESNAS